MFKFNLTQAESQTVLDALTSQPYSKVASLITNMMQQADAQQGAPVAQPTPPADPSDMEPLDEEALAVTPPRS